jgi:hypothetical protein
MSSLRADRALALIKQDMINHNDRQLTNIAISSMSFPEFLAEIRRISNHEDRKRAQVWLLEAASRHIEDLNDAMVDLSDWATEEPLWKTGLTATLEEVYPAIHQAALKGKRSRTNRAGYQNTVRQR